MRDIARTPVVPGANDNLSGVAGLVALAEALRERPVDGPAGRARLLRRRGGPAGRDLRLRPRHLAPLDRERTWVLNLETLGSPELAMLEGEGAFVMEDYFDRGFRDLCAGSRRARNPDAARDARDDEHRHGGPEPDGDPDRLPDLAQPPQGTRQLPLAHRRPENLNYATIAAAADLAEARHPASSLPALNRRTRTPARGSLGRREDGGLGAEDGPRRAR